MSEYTLENVMCPECGHSAKEHIWDEWSGWECEGADCKCKNAPLPILLHHLNAVAKERYAAIDALEKHLPFPNKAQIYGVMPTVYGNFETCAALVLAGRYEYTDETKTAIKRIDSKP